MAVNLWECGIEEITGQSQDNHSENWQKLHIHYRYMLLTSASLASLESTVGLTSSNQDRHVIYVYAWKSLSCIRTKMAFWEKLSFFLFSFNWLRKFSLISLILIENQRVLSFLFVTLVTQQLLKNVFQGHIQISWSNSVLKSGSKIKCRTE